MLRACVDRMCVCVCVCECVLIGISQSPPYERHIEAWRNVRATSVLRGVMGGLPSERGDVGEQHPPLGDEAEVGLAGGHPPSLRHLPLLGIPATGGPGVGSRRGQGGGG